MRQAGILSGLFLRDLLQLPCTKPFGNGLDSLAPANRFWPRQSESRNGIGCASTIAKYPRTDLTRDANGGVPLQRIDGIAVHYSPHCLTRLVTPGSQGGKHARRYGVTTRDRAM